MACSAPEQTKGLPPCNLKRTHLSLATCPEIEIASRPEVVGCDGTGFGGDGAAGERQARDAAAVDRALHRLGGSGDTNRLE